ncbi:MAG TPA: rhomboid family intramembrane serine protease [Pirellulaceae bacterium]|nr:rhomboid family intramembrane serine protease [Pirellulaceae bacterium]HMO91613.1 rhomboid family intramembrane serine protease [Pirellulaceae bacterium]HMP68310.1 rhomboid family intramembrane serine protease [Pirellulaceae bacterium]
MLEGRITKILFQVGWFVAAVWLVFIVDLVIPYRLNQWGVIPRKLDGLVGILCSPFLHASFTHLVANTVPLTVLLVFFTSSRRSAWLRVFEILVLSGGFLWLFGRRGSEQVIYVHIGASGLIYGLASYLVVVGLREQRLVSLAVSMAVLLVYGATFFFGLLPMQPGISWDGHLFGALAGAALAMLFPVEFPNRQLLHNTDSV